MPATLPTLDPLVASAFRRPAFRLDANHLTLKHSGTTFALAALRSSEGRRDRILPLLAQAILEAQAHSRTLGGGTVPLALLTAPAISPAVATAAQAFARQVAPDVAIGLLDHAGFRAFSGHGLEVLNARPPVTSKLLRRQAPPQRLPHLFSDLNQWMLKILLAPALAPDLLSAPRHPITNPTSLARAANVSVMSATRLLRSLEAQGFLDLTHESLALVRIPELLARWSTPRESVQEFPVRWLIQQSPGALPALLRSTAAQSGSTPRFCFGLFAAADTLGYSFVHGVPPHIYLERPDSPLLARWGLTPTQPSEKPDATIRIPSNPESVFRAAVSKDGIPCSDILQIWLDVSHHPSRGKAQAAEIARQVLKPLLKAK